MNVYIIYTIIFIVVFIISFILLGRIGARRGKP